ncbi:hypothetical protein FYK55_19560 [Roseiconus nitratireducens]|uniref:Uncharacterized protein n=1 Tax=Roseiconus nitratireducens TaxID=2605748 RepID=A0A5M6D483_9BACT|nr:hypothetical protein [Roseiconus nitratireducens]KAA5541092.1 hypothetical protein FYK55_19560 [Roseiconus nitratireducens]
MRNIVFAVVAVVMSGLGQWAVASPFDAGESILSPPADAAQTSDVAPLPPGPVPQTTVSAPAINPGQPQPVIEAPITDSTVVHADGQAEQHVHQHVHRQPVRYYRAPQKQSFFDKLMDMERKKNAWLKRTFLGM